MATTRATSAQTPPVSLKRRLEEGVAWWRALGQQVEAEGVSVLPAPLLNYRRLSPALQRAVIRGYVPLRSAQFVHEMFTIGCQLGVNIEEFELSRKGTKWHRNYKSATDHREPVSKGIRKRVDKGTSVCLGRISGKQDLDLLPVNSIIFPMGGTEKRLEVSEWRPTSDHTKSQLNLYTSLFDLLHSITSDTDILRWFVDGSYMAVGDVADAFPMIPLIPAIWKWFLFVWYNPYDHQDPAEYLFASLCADFGTRGAPGAFKILFADVLVGVARSELIITLPMPIHVDDFALIGASAAQVNAEMDAFGAFMAGVNAPLKDLKGKRANQRQEMIGFIWDSLSLTRELLAVKRIAYVDTWHRHAASRALTLRELQSDAGTIHRAIRTLPPGAGIFMANVLTAARGLSLPWHKRRVNGLMRRDYAQISSLIQQNLGKGYFDFRHFARAPDIHTDASKGMSFAGGGYFSMCGRYNYWIYGSRARRALIDELEGDTSFAALDDLGKAGLLHRRLVRLRIDNSAFQLSAYKGWSRTDRLNRILFAIFQLCLRYECVVEWVWISTHRNLYADALSRPLSTGHGEPLFLSLVYSTGIVSRPLLRRNPSAGALRQLGDRYSSNNLKDGPGSKGRRPPISYTATYEAVSIYHDLPLSCVAPLDLLMDNRLSSSSRRTVSSALTHWRVVCDRHGWDRTILSLDKARGSKLAAFLTYLAYETDLAYGSISGYMWGLRTHMKLQRQFDPALGVVEYDDMMTAAAVVTWVASEPRIEIPLVIVREALERVDRTCFWEVQSALEMCIELSTFARSESIVAGALSGERAFDRVKNLQVKDLCVFPAGTRIGASFTRRSCLGIRLKGIKQDPRIERPEAQGNNDWVYIGDVDDPVLSVLGWVSDFFALLAQHRPGPRDPESPLFLHRDMTQPHTYANLNADYRALWARAPSCVDASRYGSHSLRVAGFNAVNRSPQVESGLPVAHGGWHGGEERYMRFRAAQVLDLTRALWGDWLAADGDAPPAADAFSPPPRQPGPRLPLGSARRAVSASAPPVSSPARPVASASAPAAPLPACPDAGVASSPLHDGWLQSSELPAGWQVRQVVAQSGRIYFTYRSPAGVQYRSLAQARAAAAPPAAVVAPPAAQPAPAAAALAATLAAGAHPADVGSLSFRFPHDLSEHEGYFDRPSRRPPPASRRGD
jgi:hypothetical protein